MVLVITVGSVDATSQTYILGDGRTIPLSEDLHDVEEKMQWIIDHDELAQSIAYRGSLWMQDLVYHPEAADDDRLVQEEIVRRYLQHFQEVTN
jgi:hypothetical protein